jgi:hypothetical protein
VFHFEFKLKKNLAVTQGFFCGYLVYDFIDNHGSFSLPLMAAVSFFCHFFCLGRLAHAKKCGKKR